MRITPEPEQTAIEESKTPPRFNQKPDIYLTEEKKERPMTRNYEVLREQSKKMQEKLSKIQSNNHQEDIEVTQIPVAKQSPIIKHGLNFEKIDEVTEESKDREEVKYDSNNQAEHKWDEFDQLETSSEHMEEDSEISVHTITMHTSNHRCQDYGYREPSEEEIKIKPTNMDNWLNMWKPIRRILCQERILPKYSNSVETIVITGTDNELYDYPYRDAFEV